MGVFVQRSLFLRMNRATYGIVAVLAVAVAAGAGYWAGQRPTAPTAAGAGASPAGGSAPAKGGPTGGAGDACAVGTGNRPSRELGHVAKEFDHPAGPGHQSGNPTQPGIQIDLVRLALRGRQIGPRSGSAAGLGIVISHLG